MDERVRWATLKLTPLCGWCSAELAWPHAGINPDQEIEGQCGVCGGFYRAVFVTRQQPQSAISE